MSTNRNRTLARLLIVLALGLLLLATWGTVRWTRAGREQAQRRKGVNLAAMCAQTSVPFLAMGESSALARSLAILGPDTDVLAAAVVGVQSDSLTVLAKKQFRGEPVELKPLLDPMGQGQEYVYGYKIDNRTLAAVRMQDGGRDAENCFDVGKRWFLVVVLENKKDPVLEPVGITFALVGLSLLGLGLAAGFLLDHDGRRPKGA